MEDDSEIIDGFFDDNDEPRESDLVSKPALCLTCRKDSDPGEEEMCMLTRMDTIEGEDFVCGAYEKTT
jgi:hypothetical protein